MIDGAAVGAADVGKNVGTSVKKLVGAEVCGGIGVTVGAGVEALVGDAVGSVVGFTVEAGVGAPVGDAVSGSAVGEGVGTGVEAAVGVDVGSVSSKYTLTGVDHCSCRSAAAAQRKAPPKFGNTSATAFRIETA